MSNAATPEVLAMGEIHLEGNVIPQSWYQHIKLETGKPDIESIIILSEIVYWYRPTYVREERNGQISAVNKKFKGDALQRNKQSFCDQFGFAPRKVQDSLARLEKDGYITRDYRTITVLDGIQMSNVLFIKIHPEKIKAISIQKLDTYGRNLPYPKENSTNSPVEICQINTENTTQRKKKKKKEESLSGIEFDREAKEFINISEADKADWVKHYVGVDVDRELFQMRQWLLDPENPPRDGNRTFINNWLKRSFETPKKKLQNPKAQETQPVDDQDGRPTIPYDSDIARFRLEQKGEQGLINYLNKVSDPKHLAEYLASRGKNES